MSEYNDIPEVTIGTLERYVHKGIAPGGFMTAVLSNDLFGAVGRADLGNVKALDKIVKYIYNRCPSGCHGSKQIVEDWCKMGGLEGLSNGPR